MINSAQNNELKNIVFRLKGYLEYYRDLGHIGFLNQGDVSGELNKLKEIQKEVDTCEKCRLHKSRTNTVFGSGDFEAEIMFIGEAPGRDEDLQGKPFVGRAGQLLTRIIESINLKREEVFITNILKCRPPDNRNPHPEEIFACEPFLIQQLNIIKPKIICALGTFAAQTLLKTEQPISSLRGRVHYYNQTKLIPTFHPAFLLRNEKHKRLTWEDMKLLRREYLSLL